MQNAQKAVLDFIDKWSLSCGADVRLLDLSAEVGEVCGAYAKATDYGKRPYTPNADVTGEMGDALFSILAACGALGIDARQALYGALQKYETRMRRKGSAGSDNETTNP